MWLGARWVQSTFALTLVITSVIITDKRERETETDMSIGHDANKIQTFLLGRSALLTTCHSLRITTKHSHASILQLLKQVVLHKHPPITTKKQGPRAPNEPKSADTSIALDKSSTKSCSKALV